MIRNASPVEHELLTTISFRSKSYWSYPEEYLRIWERELTITPEYIDCHEIFVYEKDRVVIAYYSLVELTEDMLFSGAKLSAGLWLDHMFVLPEHMGRGGGTLFFAHCCRRVSERGALRLHILADPNALGFYLKMGCVCHGHYPSSIPGRTTPFLVHACDRRSHC